MRPTAVALRRRWAGGGLPAVALLARVARLESLPAGCNVGVGTEAPMKDVAYPDGEQPGGEQPTQLVVQLLSVRGLVLGLAMCGDWEHQLALHVVVLTLSLAR